MNHFTGRHVAERYAAYRPATHGTAVCEIASFLGLGERLECAVDVGCGTGFSTVPLARIARRVVGIDPAPEMIHRADRIEGVRYLVGSAEREPLASACCDLITVCSAFHWFGGSASLDECRRIGRPGAPLVLYSNSLLGGTENCPEFSSWFEGEFRDRYPRVRAGNTIVDAEGMARCGFRRTGQRQVRVEVCLSAEQLAGCLSTRSNVIAAVGDDASCLAAAGDEMRLDLEQLLGTGDQRVAFGGDIIFYEAADQRESV